MTTAVVGVQASRNRAVQRRATSASSGQGLATTVRQPAPSSALGRPTERVENGAASVRPPLHTSSTTNSQPARAVATRVIEKWCARSSPTAEK